MSWNGLPRDVQEIAERCLTEKQMQVFKLVLGGMNDRQISHALLLSRSTVRSRLEAVYLNLAREGVSQDGSGHWRVKT